MTKKDKKALNMLEFAYKQLEAAADFINDDSPQTWGSIQTADNLTEALNLIDYEIEGLK